MESSILGLVLDSDPLITAERSKITALETISRIRKFIGDVPIVTSALTLSELAHGIYRANTPERRTQRRKFVDEVKLEIPVIPITAVTAEIIARISGEQAAKGVLLPIGDVIIGACALELGYAVGTGNLRDFGRIPGLTVVHL